MPSNSRTLAARLQQVGAPVTLRLYEGVNHVDPVTSLAAAFRKRTPALQESTSFLLDYSRPERQRRRASR
jgi:acetyl esterase/lipase